MGSYDFKYKNFQKIKWIRIFYHNYAIASTYFTDNECKSSTNPNKFSALKELTVLSGYKGKYEFLLEYPTISFCIRWKQKELPTTTEKELNKDVGLVVLYCTHKYDSFQGLMLSNTENSYLDGSSYYYDNYRYSICTKSFTDRIPGPIYNNSGERNFPNINEVALWLRVKGECLTLNSKNMQTKILFIHIFFI